MNALLDIKTYRTENFVCTTYNVFLLTNSVMTKYQSVVYGAVRDAYYTSITFHIHPSSFQVTIDIDVRVMAY